MKTKLTSITIHVFLAVLLIFTSTGAGLASTHQNLSTLVRIELRSPDDSDLLAAADIPIHAWLYDQVGNPSILSWVDVEQRRGLDQLNLSVHILDGDPQGKDYYLVRLDTPNARPGLHEVSTVLDVVGGQAIVSVSNQQTLDFFDLGFDVKHINFQPVVIAQEEIILAPAPPLEPNPTIQQMIDQVYSTTVSTVEGSLSGEWPVIIGGTPYTITTRHSSNATASEMATQYVYEQFETMGLNTTYHNYAHPYYGSRRNVVAEQPGLNHPDRIYLITAHLDDMPSGPIAPGADDNASGSTGVLLAAEILSQYNFDCTLRYVLFTGEEQGLLGSYYYAEDAYNAGDDIKAVLNLDMIAYNSDTQPILDLHTRPANGSDLYIANIFVDVVSAYTIPLTADIHQDGAHYSDHDSFWTYGYPAILAIEDEDDFTPYYHTVDDTLSSLDLIYFTNFIKASLATIAHLGGLIPVSGTVSGMVTESDGNAPIPGATVDAIQGDTVISSTTTISDGSYSLELISGTYTIKASSPGYIAQSSSNITVTSGGNTIVDFELEKTEPVAGLDFIYSPQRVTLGQTVTFTGTVISGTLPITFTWDFGDDSTGSGEVITHSFPISAAPTTYTVTLSAENDYGLPLSMEKAVTVWSYQIFVPMLVKPEL